MANYDSLINAVKAAVKTNGTGAITGATLQATLLGTIEELTAGFQFMGVATPETTPDSNDKKEFYLGFAGTYANFGSSVTVPEGSVILFKKNNGAWSSQVVKIVDPVSVSQDGETGHTDINIGGNSYPVASVEDVSRLGQYFNPTKNGFANRCLMDIKIVGTKQSGLKYFLRSCSLNYSLLGGFYLAIQSYNPLTEERATICEFYASQSGVYSQTLNGYTTTIIAILENIADGDGFYAVNYAEEYEITDSCWGAAHPLIDALSEDSTPIKISQIRVDDSFSEFFEFELLPNLYWGESGLTSAFGFYATKQLIPIVGGETIRLEQFINPETAQTSAAGFLYDKNFNAVGSRIDIQDLTVISAQDNILAYTIPFGTTAVYIGFSTTLTNPKKIRAVYPFAITETAKRVAKSKYNEVDLMMFMGQSNMAGRGVSTTTYPEKAPYVPLKCGQEFRPVTDPTKLYQIEEPFGVNENNAGINDGDMKTGGLVSAFANAYYQTCGTPIVGVSASKGGSNITEWQMDGTYLPESISRFNAAVSFLESHHYKIRHKYMVWLQGENDATRVSTYKTLFRNVVDAMENAGVECCLLIRIGRNSSNTEQDGIVNLQTEICKESDDVILISTILAQYAAKGEMKDTQHFYQFSYNECGKQAGHNAAIYSIAKAERMQYDCMTQDMYFSEKCL